MPAPVALAVKFTMDPESDAVTGKEALALIAVTKALASVAVVLLCP